MLLSASDFVSARKTLSTVRLPHRCESSLTAWRKLPWWEASMAALMAPAETPVMKGSSSCGNLRARQRRKPT